MNTNQDNFYFRPWGDGKRRIREKDQWLGLYVKPVGRTETWIVCGILINLITLCQPDDSGITLTTVRNQVEILSDKPCRLITYKKHRYLVTPDRVVISVLWSRTLKPSESETAKAVLKIFDKRERR